MKLNKAAIMTPDYWTQRGYALPRFSVEAMKEKTQQTPRWIHFGAGNIFRAYLAALQQQLLDQELTDTGIIAVGGEVVDLLFEPHDNLTLLVTIYADGRFEKSVVGSVAEALNIEVATDSQRQDLNRLKEVFASPSLQVVSFTITEKGYRLDDGQQGYAPLVAADFMREPAKAESYMGKVAALLYERYLKGGWPVAMVSLDNCSHNGDKLFQAIRCFAAKWVEQGVVEAGYLNYVENPQKVSFPWSMIDKITPQPSEAIRKVLAEDGLEGLENIITARKSQAAPFVNAEKPGYLVIEDLFPNGRPPLEEAGVIFTDREHVDMVEKMKVCTCLNPLHTALAIFGCLLGHTAISDEMNDTDLKQLVERIGYEEGLPVVVDPGIINPKAFIDEVLQERFSNPYMPDTPQRIATDTSQKLGIRFGETIKAYQKKHPEKLVELVGIPLVLAGWCRYLLGVDDLEDPMTLSPDPLLSEVQQHVAGIKVGDRGSFSKQLAPILSNAAIFGVDLYAVGLGEKVEGLFQELAAGRGSVRETLKKYL